MPGKKKPTTAEQIRNIKGLKGFYKTEFRATPGLRCWKMSHACPGCFISNFTELTRSPHLGLGMCHCGTPPPPPPAQDCWDQAEALVCEPLLEAP